MPSNRKQNRIAEKDAVGTVWESIKGWITNISFKIEEFTAFPISNAPVSFDSLTANHQSCFIAGSKISNYQDFITKTKSLIWFTYRKNAEIGRHTYSDIGWGCLLRVTQMAIANVLLSFSQTNSGISRTEIINACTERSEAEYGIINFIETGAEMWNRQVGDWYSMTEVSMILQGLQEQNPLRGTEHLKVVVYNQIISIDELFDYFQNSLEDGSLDHNERNKLSSIQQIPSIEVITCESKDKKKGHTQIFLMITTQLNGCSRVKNQQQLLHLMELPIFSSCLGGVPQKARFITGKFGNQLCYLDPHYVQQAVQSNLEQELNTYSCSKPRWMSCDELESNLTICFHLKNQEDVRLLMRTIDETQQAQANESFFDYSWSAKVNRRPINQTQQIEPQFEILGSESFEIIS